MGWDKGVDFLKMRKELNKRLKEAKERGKTKQFCYYAVLMIQLINGSRIGEAIEFFTKVVKEGVKEAEIQLEKHKQGETRKMNLPEELKPKELRVCLYITEEGKEKLKKRLKTFCRYNLGINTHSLRYAFVSHLAKKGYPAQIIAKITGHKNLRHILTYTQKKLAEEVLKSIIEGII
jgi:integrase